MGQFKPMTKMMTTEPSVILKLKKGGHVNSKEEACEQDGHKPMGKGLTVAIAVGKPRGGDAGGDSPGKPSIADRRKAMAAPFMKKGGKAVKKAMGGPIGAPGAVPVAPMMARPAVRPAMPAGLPMTAPAGLPARPMMRKEGGSTDMAQDKAMIKKAMSQHDAQEHKGGKGTKLALKDGGISGVGKGPGGFATGGTIKGNAGKFLNSLMSPDKPSKTPNVSGVVKGKDSAAGFATGGTIKGNAGKFLNTDMSPDKAPKSDHNSGVPKGTAGFKMGGSTKKAYATGGSVDGSPVAMPRKPASKPVSNTTQSGTFKKGGKVSRKADGGPVSDSSKGAYDKSIGPSDDDMDMARMIRNAPGDAYSAMKKMFGGAPSAGAGRGFVNPPMARDVVKKADGGSLNLPSAAQQSAPSVLAGGVPNAMPDQSLPPLAAQEAMQKALGSGENAYKRGGRARRVHKSSMNRPQRLQYQG